MGLKPKCVSGVGVESACEAFMALKASRLLTFLLKREMWDILETGSSWLVAICLHWGSVRSKLGHAAVSLSLQANACVEAHKYCFALE